MDLFVEEKKLKRKGFKIIVGIDEVGRGPLAGPVMACALVFYSRAKLPKDLKGINDSKKLTPKKREKFYCVLKNNPNIEWGIGRVSERIIDKINILEATKLAMERAVMNLSRKMNKEIKFLIIDGNFGIKLDLPQKSIKKADGKIFSVIAASIVAKVTRDRLMKRLDKKYPQYRFAAHKGYPTELHRKLLKKHGPCKIHRETFYPVRAVRIITKSFHSRLVK